MTVLVAGVGNIFLSDDGFGVEVIKELEGIGLSPAVEAAVDPAVTLVQDLINEHRVPSLDGGHKQGGMTT